MVDLRNRKSIPDESFDELEILGSTGLKHSHGYVLEEFLRRLAGHKATALYEEMSKNSSTVGALLFITESLARQVEWRVVAASDKPRAVKEKEFLEGALFEDMSLTWPELLTEILSFLPFGWSFTELVYKRRQGPDNPDPSKRSIFTDNRYGWRKIEIRAQQSLHKWEISPEDGSILGMWQIDPYNPRKSQTFIPIEKALLFRTKRQRNNPEGVSILRTAVVDYFFLKRIQEIEAIGIDREFAGLPHMEMPIEYLNAAPGSKHANLRKKVEDMLASIRTDERAFIIVPPEMDRDNKPTGWKFRLVSTGGRRAIDTHATKNYYKQGIFQSALAQFLQLGFDGMGSHAQVRESVSTFGTALGGHLDAIAAVFNRFAIPRLMKLNGIERKYWPRLEHGKVEGPSMAELANSVSKLVATEVMRPDDKLENRMREKLDLPVLSEEELAKREKEREEMKEQMQAQPQEGPAATNGSSLEDREQQRAEESVTDDLVNREE